MDGYDLDKKVLASVRNGTEISQIGYWPIETANKWTIAHPRMLFKFNAMKAHIVNHVFGMDYWGRLTHLRHSTRTDKRQVSYMFSTLKELLHVKKRSRHQPKAEQQYKVGFKANKVIPNDEDPSVHFAEKQKNSVKKKIVPPKKEKSAQDVYETEGGHTVRTAIGICCCQLKALFLAPSNSLFALLFITFIDFLC